MFDYSSAEAIRQELRIQDERMRKDIEEMVRDARSRLQHEFRLEIENASQKLKYEIERKVSAAERAASSAKFDIDMLTLYVIMTFSTLLMLGLAFSHTK